MLPLSVSEWSNSMRFQVEVEEQMRLVRTSVLDHLDLYPEVPSLAPGLPAEWGFSVAAFTAAACSLPDPGPWVPFASPASLRRSAGLSLLWLWRGQLSFTR